MACKCVARTHIAHMHFRPLPVMSLLAMPSLALLLTLGSWQWQRFDLKRGIDAAPPPIAQSLATALADGAQEYEPVIVTGSWQAGRVDVYALDQGTRGARGFGLFKTEDGGLILAERGFVAEGSTPAAPATGTVTLRGVLRIGAKANAFTPDNDAAGGTFYWVDVPELARRLGASEPLASPLYLAPSEVDPLATGTPVANPFANPKGADQLPAERHLGYALTWWGLAGALVGVYLALHVARGRLRLR
jgi:surfeit locus 1 family protein